MGTRSWRSRPGGLRADRGGRRERSVTSSSPPDAAGLRSGDSIMAPPPGEGATMGARDPTTNRTDPEPGGWVDLDGESGRITRVRRATPRRLMNRMIPCVPTASGGVKEIRHGSPECPAVRWRGGPVAGGGRDLSSSLHHEDAPIGSRIHIPPPTGVSGPPPPGNRKAGVAPPPIDGRPAPGACRGGGYGAGSPGAGLDSPHPRPPLRNVMGGGDGGLPHGLLGE